MCDGLSSKVLVAIVFFVEKLVGAKACFAQTLAACLCPKTIFCTKISVPKLAICKNFFFKSFSLDPDLNDIPEGNGTI